MLPIQLIAIEDSPEHLHGQRRARAEEAANPDPRISAGATVGGLSPRIKHLAKMLLPLLGDDQIAQLVAQPAGVTISHLHNWLDPLGDVRVKGIDDVHLNFLPAVHEKYLRRLREKVIRAAHMRHQKPMYKQYNWNRAASRWVIQTLLCESLHHSRWVGQWIQCGQPFQEHNRPNGWWHCRQLALHQLTQFRLPDLGYLAWRDIGLDPIGVNQKCLARRLLAVQCVDCQQQHVDAQDVQ